MKPTRVLVLIGVVSLAVALIGLGDEPASIVPWVIAGFALSAVFILALIAQAGRGTEQRSSS